MSRTVCRRDRGKAVTAKQNEAEREEEARSKRWNMQRWMEEVRFANNWNLGVGRNRWRWICNALQVELCGPPIAPHSSPRMAMWERGGRR